MQIKVLCICWDLWTYMELHSYIFTVSTLKQIFIPSTWVLCFCVSYMLTHTESVWILIIKFKYRRDVYFLLVGEYYHCVCNDPKTYLCKQNRASEISCACCCILHGFEASFLAEVAFSFDNVCTNLCRRWHKRNLIIKRLYVFLLWMSVNDLITAWLK